jgi:beta-mannosidase
VFLTQVVQAEGLKYAVEHWRRRKFLTAGTLIWQLNDCWLTSSNWALMDYYMNLKPSFYSVKKAYSPVLVSIEKKPKSCSVWVVNDTLKTVSGTLIVEVLSLLNNKRYFKKQVRGSVTVNSSKRLVQIDDVEFKLIDLVGKYIRAELVDNKTKKKYTNYHLFEPIKKIQASEGKLFAITKTWLKKVTD